MRLPSHMYESLGFSHEQFEQAMLLVQQLGSNQAADREMALAPGTVARWAKEWIKAQRAYEHLQDNEGSTTMDLGRQLEREDDTQLRQSRNSLRQNRRAAIVGRSRAELDLAEPGYEDAEEALQAFRKGAEARSARSIASLEPASLELAPGQADAPQQRILALARLEEVAEGLRKLSEISERAALTQSKASADEEIKSMLKLATSMMEFMRKQQDSNEEQLGLVQAHLRRIEAFQQQPAARNEPGVAIITQLEALSQAIDELSTEEQIIQVQDDVADLRDLIDETLRLAPRLQEVVRELFRHELHDQSRFLGERLAALLRQHADAMIESDARMPGAIAELIAGDWEPSFAELHQILEQNSRQQSISFANLQQDLERREQGLRIWFEQQDQASVQRQQQHDRAQQAAITEMIGSIGNVSGQVDGVRRLVDEYGSVSAQAEQIHRLHQEIARLQRVVEQMQEKSILRITL